ncbi:hypothetical protein R3P38DRAFT_2791389 [Favolaschia claudopus]|uniref:Uncharacterized protein n=1 Tax=Favolaschia claudopus TaxID=2862362 RepID=A0AAW0AI98_9AGAR
MLDNHSSAAVAQEIQINDRNSGIANDILSNIDVMFCFGIVYSPRDISINPQQFLDYKWIDIDLLGAFLAQHGGTEAVNPDLTSASASVVVKIKPHPLALPVPAQVHVKLEPQSAAVPEDRGDVKICTVHKDFEHGDSDVEVAEMLRPVSRLSSVVAAHLSPAEDVNKYPLITSDTVWQDDGISFACIGKFRVTKKVTVDRMEYCEVPAALYLILCVRTAFVVDLSGSKYHYRDPESGELYTLDSIIRNADNNSWDSGSGGRAGAMVTFGPDNVPEHLSQRGFWVHSSPTILQRIGAPPCSTIIHPHMGLKKKKCLFGHIVDGKAVKGKIKNYLCDAKQFQKTHGFTKVMLFKGDTTYAGVDAAKLNEWELTIFVNVVQHTVHLVHWKVLGQISSQLEFVKKLVLRQLRPVDES